jgi:very-short-patch-repair endonuclease
VLPYSHHLKPFSRRLRTGMTDAKQKLWHRLRRKQIDGLQFYRQKPIGPYIVDFYAHQAKLVIEIDGAQHLDTLGRYRDTARDAWLRQQGLRVLRFDNLQVLRETDAVLEAIASMARERVAS